VTVRLSRAKINRLADIVIELLQQVDYVDFPPGVDAPALRVSIKKAIEKELHMYQEIEEKVIQKIKSQRKTVVEGSREWDILFRKYYNEEIGKLDKTL